MNLFKNIVFGFFLVTTATLGLGHSAMAAVLTDSNGMTVYTFDEDQGGVSSCYDSCAQAWPPVLANGQSLDAPFAEVARKDGSEQLTYDGKPIYTFSGDSAPGQTHGDGLDGTWHVIQK
jgi:predicted lipoprotein with Yx(FWY)xxD motif